jgi:hypothetical protein
MKKTGSHGKYLILLLIGVISLFSWVYREPILIQAGRYLTPGWKGQADVVIIAGNQYVEEKAARVGHALFVSESARKMVIVVLHQGVGDENLFGIPRYDLAVGRSLESLGVRKGQYQVLTTPKDHPVTLREAEIVMAKLSSEDIRTALLLAEGFHMRRSYWAYQEAAKIYGIKIIPHPVFIKYQSDSWWKKSWGVRDFVSESAKFLYYVVIGYIPPRSLVSLN